MSFIKHETINIGDIIETTKIHSSFSGYFEIGTKVMIIEVDQIRGYAIQDEFGNIIREIGWII